MMIRLPLLLFSLLTVSAEAGFWRGLKRQLEDLPDAGLQEESEDQPEPSGRSCSMSGMSKFPYQGKDNSERLLLREGVIDAIPSSLCGHNNTKNVILVVGDGMVSPDRECKPLFERESNL